MKAAIRKATALGTLIVVTALSGPSQADQAKPAPATDEMVVTNTVPSAGLHELSRDMKKAQDRFLDLYNKVNRNTDQRLSCADRAPTGTRLSQRSCSTRAQTRATEEMARNFMGAVDGVNANVAQTAAVAAQASTNAQAGVPLTAEQSAALSGGGQAPDSNVDVKSGEAVSKVSEQRLEFERNLEELLEKNPELRQRYEDYLAARKRYLEAGGRM